MLGDDGHALALDDIKESVVVQRVPAFSGKEETIPRRKSKSKWAVAQTRYRAVMAIAASPSSLASSSELGMPLEERGSGMRLPIPLQDRHDNAFELQAMYMHRCSFDVIVVQFSIVSMGPVNVQAVLDLQNAVMRLGVNNSVECPPAECVCLER